MAMPSFMRFARRATGGNGYASRLQNASTNSYFGALKHHVGDHAPGHVFNALGGNKVPLLSGLFNIWNVRRLDKRQTARMEAFKQARQSDKDRKNQPVNPATGKPWTKQEKQDWWDNYKAQRQQQTKPQGAVNSKTGKPWTREEWQKEPARYARESVASKSSNAKPAAGMKPGSTFQQEPSAADGKAWHKWYRAQQAKDEGSVAKKSQKRQGAADNDHVQYEAAAKRGAAHDFKGDVMAKDIGEIKDTLHRIEKGKTKGGKKEGGIGGAIKGILGSIFPEIAELGALGMAKKFGGKALVGLLRGGRALGGGILRAGGGLLRGRAIPGLFKGGGVIGKVATVGMGGIRALGGTLAKNFPALAGAAAALGPKLAGYGKAGLEAGAPVIKAGKSAVGKAAEASKSLLSKAFSIGGASPVTKAGAEAVAATATGGKVAAGAVDAIAKPRMVLKDGKWVAKEGAEVGGKVAGKAGLEVAAKIGGKAVAKTAAKSIIKKIPVIGALAGLGFGIYRAAKGDWAGAAGEVASGLAGTIPGVGTAASVGIDVANSVHEEEFDRKAEEAAGKSKEPGGPMYVDKEGKKYTEEQVANGEVVADSVRREDQPDFSNVESGSTTSNITPEIPKIASTNVDATPHDAAQALGQMLALMTDPKKGIYIQMASNLFEGKAKPPREGTESPNQITPDAQPMHAERQPTQTESSFGPAESPNQITGDVTYTPPAQRMSDFQRMTAMRLKHAQYRGTHEANSRPFAYDKRGVPYSEAEMAEGKKGAPPVDKSSLAPAMATNPDLGALSAKYESSRSGSAAYGYDTTGGASYGKYQIATKTGTMDEFMKFLKTSNPAAYEALSPVAGSAGEGKSGQFYQAWQKAAKDGTLGNSEHDFIKSTHFDPAAQSVLKNTGFDVGQHSKAVQDALWSTSVQHGAGGASKIFGRLGDLNSMSDEQIINKLYQERSANGGNKYFGSSTEQTRQSVLNRFESERKDALAELQAAPSDQNGLLAQMQKADQMSLSEALTKTAAETQESKAPVVIPVPSPAPVATAPRGGSGDPSGAGLKSPLISRNDDSSIRRLTDSFRGKAMV